MEETLKSGEGRHENTNGWDGGHNFTQFEFVQDGCFT
jgi:hypothetical protein